IDETGEQAVIRPETTAPEQTAANRDGGFSDSRPPRADINGAGEQAVVRPETTASEQTALNRDGGFSDSRPPRADIRNAARQNLRGSGAAKAPAAAGITRSESAFTVPPPSDFTVDDAFADGKTQAVFYERVKPQLDELFSQNPEFDALLKAMPQTKWVKVDYDGEGKYYVVGVIGDRPDYLCYGVPASFTPEPPAELDGYCQWLPLDAQSPQGKGFWLMFQDAVTGESVRKL
ncbi:MAG: hypothetical protein LBP26_02070, partial [Clostridiales bacterium]|nr:hypothetical protein [Clostridiales bacterium]